MIYLALGAPTRMAGNWRVGKAGRHKRKEDNSCFCAICMHKGLKRHSVTAVSASFKMQMALLGRSLCVRNL